MMTPASSEMSKDNVEILMHLYIHTYKDNKEAVYPITDMLHIHTPFNVYRDIHLVWYS